MAFEVLYDYRGWYQQTLNNYKPRYKLTGGKGSVTCSFMKTEEVLI